MPFTYPDDPATRYARAVIDGTEIAPRLVTLAARRHLDDLAHAGQRGLVWRADAARTVCDFFPEILRLPDGEQGDEGEHGGEGTPFVLAPWEAFVAGSVEGWRTTAGHRRFRVAYCEIGKGAGKTAFAAGLLLYQLVTSRSAKQFYCAATAQQQARLTFADCVRMVQASPHLRALIDQRVNNLAVMSTGSFLRPISSEKRGLDGKRVAGAVVDELHEHADEVVTAKLRAGVKGDRDALILEITNSGSDLESVCRKHHDYSKQVLTGEATNDAWFAFVCHLDACDKCFAAGNWQPSDDCPDCDDWRTEGPHWRKANPGLGTALPWQYLREQVREGVDIPSQRNLVRRLNFCQWTTTTTVWLSPEKWHACGDSTLTLELLTGREVYLGVDLSAKVDLSAVALVFPRPAYDDASADTLNLCVDTLVRFWMPANTLRRRAAADRVPYPDWERAEALTVTPGDLIDSDAIAAFVLEEIAPRYQIRGIGVDQAGATAFVTRLQRELGDVVIEVPQSFRFLSEPCKTLEALVVSGRLRHDNNPVLAWNASNLAIEENRWREIRPIKITQRQRIDGCVALVDALAAMALKREPDVESIYESTGMFVVDF